MIFLDGRLVDRRPSIVPPVDVGGVFTTIGCDNGKPLLWDRHLARLHSSLPAFSSRARAQLPGGDQLEELLRSEGFGNSPARIRVVVWVDVRGALKVEGSVAAAGPVGPDRDPVKLEVIRWRTPPNPAVKWVARQAWHEAGRVARTCGCDDALLVDGDGRVLETSIANIFVRRGASVLTPPAPAVCLPGIMRNWLITNLEVEESEIHLESLMSADEVWISNAVAGIVRVRSVGRVTWHRWQAFHGLTRLGVPAPGWPAR